MGNTAYCWASYVRPSAWAAGQFAESSQMSTLYITNNEYKTDYGLVRIFFEGTGGRVSFKKE
jgi:hypothetical protein